eukprot:6183856-Pleurochrysis_carterae.AAC.1
MGCLTPRPFCQRRCEGRQRVVLLHARRPLLRHWPHSRRFASAAQLRPVGNRERRAWRSSEDCRERPGARPGEKLPPRLPS